MRILLLLLLLAGCSTSPKKPPYPPLPTRFIGPMPEPRGIRAAVREAVAGSEIGYIRFNYGTLVTTNYSWDLEASTNLIDWVVVKFNVGPDDETVPNFGAWRFFRMKGR